MAKAAEGSLLEKVFPRDTCEYKNWSSKFAINSVDYSRQFAPMYMLRLKALRETLKVAAKKKWGKFLSVN
jgi:DNA polymerase II small subunit/DNA polymerase delta subunit B